MGEWHNSKAHCPCQQVPQKQKCPPIPKSGPDKHKKHNALDLIKEKVLTSVDPVENEDELG